MKVSNSVTPPPTDNTGDAERHKAEVAELAAGAMTPMALPTPGAIAVIPIPERQTSAAPAARNPSRYAQWAEDKYMRALEAPQMVEAFHSGSTLEIGNTLGRQSADGGNTNIAATEPGEPNVTLHPPASPYTVMTGSVIPAVLVSGIYSICQDQSLRR